MKPDKKYSVAGIGEILWDILPEGKKLGGATSNFAFHAQQLGAESNIVSSVGNDELGKEILDYLKELELDRDFIGILKSKETGVVNVKLEHGIPEYEIKTDVAWDFIEWNSALEELAKSVDAVCFGSLAQRSQVSRNTIQQFLKSTPENCLRIYDINLRQDFYSKEVIKSSLELASVLKLNDDELPVVAELFSIKGTEKVVLEKLIDIFDLKLVALTMGSKGSLLKTRKEGSFLKVPDVVVKDTVGAGDSFTACLAMAFLNGKSLREMHRAANEIAAFVCTQNGATPFLPEILIRLVE